jgi:hypothetical protein
MEDKMTIVRTNQPKETYIAGSDRPETGCKATSVGNSADADQSDPNRHLQPRERRTRPELKSNEKWHPDLSGIKRSQSVNTPELRELVEEVFGLTDRRSQNMKGSHGGVRFGANFAGGREPQHMIVELLERRADFTASEGAAGAETKPIVNNSGK